MRRQPVRIVDGRVEGGYTGVFELICPGCGDNPYADYSEVPPRLQWLRGPRTLQAALEAYDKHLGPSPGPNGDSAESLGSPRAFRGLASGLPLAVRPARSVEAPTLKSGSRRSLSAKRLERILGCP